ncbi:MAG: pyruvate, phosphate dikinase [Elusimicrobia bacterium]|nr:pyruvate, phosphate dikinase [Elusimicrobiota bacterium]
MPSALLNKKSSGPSSTKVKKSGKTLYFFGGGRADGDESMKNLLGGKGANLAEMAGHPSLRLPVPPGFTITTEVCTYYWANKRTYPKGLKEGVAANLAHVEKLTGKKFGDTQNPLLVSVRSGARKSMPGMMETILNVGLTPETIPGLARQTGDERFVYDAYRRLIMMYSDVVMEKAENIEPADDQGIRKQLERIMDDMKRRKGYKTDTELTVGDLKVLCAEFKKRVQAVFNKPFPDDPMAQLWGSIGAVFASWMGRRAVSYRRIEKIPEEWGTAVNVQSMVFGNLGDDSATGVGFTRDPGTGENIFYGEFLINAQGEDVVAGIRTPSPINEQSRSEQSKDARSLEQAMPKVYKELYDIRNRLEEHYRDMLDIEFTIEHGRLYMLQCRVGKRNGPAAVRIALDMLKEKVITKDEAVLRVTPDQLDELLHPIVDPKAEAVTKPIAKGLPAGPGGAKGMVVFTAADAVAWNTSGKKVILVREETNPEDVEGMRAAQAILTARGGMTSHAALVARGWGKCCVVGCGALEISLHNKTVEVDGVILREGDWVTLNGSKGTVYQGEMPMKEAGESNKDLEDFTKVCNAVRRLGVRANADTPEDAGRARRFGAEGIGLFRTEHMFYGKGSEKPLFILRKMIMSKTEVERRKVLEELFPFVKADVKATMKAMHDLPVTIRTLDPPLHEFVPHQEAGLRELGKSLGISMEELEKRAQGLRESNPMMGHRGVRLGVTYPEITEMQVRAILEAAAELQKEGVKAFPEIMIPVVCNEAELTDQYALVEKVYKEVLKSKGVKNIPHLVGTMIEIPRAALVSGKIAQYAQFFSFGTNDLTQMTFGFSRDDMGGFLNPYLDKKILAADPFQTIDQEAVGELVRISVERGRKTRKDLKIGICGEHGGEPASVEFCHRTGLNYVSCSPFRVPIAIHAAAQASAKEKKK